MGKRGIVSHRAVRNPEDRPLRWRRYQYLFLIVCEDSKTEPTYFRSFKVQIPPETLFLREIGTGRSALGVVESAITERMLLEQEAGKEVDEVWAVFDTDDAATNTGLAVRFNDAIELAGSENINAAWSNEVFELWLLLHFKNVNATIPIPRTIVYQLLQNAIQIKFNDPDYQYIHGNTDIIDKVLERGNVKTAIQRAEQLLMSHQGNTPLISNPATKVHFLIKRLQELINYYQYTP
jgi:hypothetical protein